MDEFNPGQQLQLLLKKLYPNGSDNKKSFIEKIDEALICDGDFSELVYQSTINYMVRRLITTAEYLKRKYDSLDNPSERYINEIRRFLHDFTRIPTNKTELVVYLLLECLKERNRLPTQHTKNRIRINTRNRGLNCCICGQELDFEQEDQPNSFSVEHIWPRTMGGSNHDFNLKGACRRCNQDKTDYIDATDFHYEEICLVKDKTDVDFNQEFSWSYKVAVLAKSDFQCTRCGKPSEYNDELHFARSEPRDSWHFLNIDAYCSEHVPE